MNELDTMAATPDARPMDEPADPAPEVVRAPRATPRVPAAWCAQSRLMTPLGAATLVATPLGLAGLWFDGQAHHPGPLTLPLDETRPSFVQAAEALERYWRGEAVDLDALPLDPQGTPFQRAVWDGLRRIARGTTTSYGALARAIGAPSAASRAVGAAVGRNPLSVIVPCHRVVGHAGALTGYAGGLDRKRALLRLEGVLP